VSFWEVKNIILKTYVFRLVSLFFKMFLYISMNYYVGAILNEMAVKLYCFFGVIVIFSDQCRFDVSLVLFLFWVGLYLYCLKFRCTIIHVFNINHVTVKLYDQIWFIFKSLFEKSTYTKIQIFSIQANKIY
jgi:hypothetical protein